jgi:hypothetical protein
VLLVIELITAPTGMFGPLTDIPATKPAVLVTDTVELAFVVDKPLIVSEAPRRLPTELEPLSKTNVPPFGTVYDENRPAVAPANRKPPCVTVAVPVEFMEPVKLRVPVPTFTKFTAAGVTSLYRLMFPEKVVSSPNNPTVNAAAAPELNTVPDPLNPPNCPAEPAKSNRVPTPKFNRANRDPAFAAPTRIPPPVTSRIGPNAPR